MKAKIAKFLIPPARLIARYSPISRRTLWSRLIAPRLSWRDYTFVVRTESGFRMHGTTRDTIQRYVYYFGIWEPHVHAFLAARLRPGDTFVDVGANIGYFTLLAAKLVGPHGKVVAIEPSSFTLARLRANVERNGMEEIVRCIHAAASDHEGSCTLYQGDDDNIGTASIVRRSDQPSEQVPTAPLDRLLLPAEVANARVVKIDVEGAEELVLKGMESVLPKLPPNAEIVMEISPDSSAADRIMLFLANHGWNAYALMPADSLENYFSRKRQAHAVRISTPIVKRTDVMFSRIATNSIDYSRAPQLR